MIRFGDEWVPMVNPVDVIKKLGDLQESLKEIRERLSKIEKAMSDYLGVE